MSFELPDPQRDEDVLNRSPEGSSRDAQIAAYPQELTLALRTQADRLVAGEFVTGLEQINLLYEAADFVERCRVELRLLDADTAVAVSRALDLLGLALADERHVWTAEERKSYETATRLLKVPA